MISFAILASGCAVGDDDISDYCDVEVDAVTAAAGVAKYGMITLSEDDPCADLELEADTAQAQQEEVLTDTAPGVEMDHADLDRFREVTHVFVVIN